VVVVVDGSRDGFIELLEDLSGRADVILILDDDEIAVPRSRSPHGGLPAPSPPSCMTATTATTPTWTSG